MRYVRKRRLGRKLQNHETVRAWLVRPGQGSRIVSAEVQGEGGREMMRGTSWATYVGESVTMKLNRGNMYKISWNVQKDGKVSVTIDDPVYPPGWGVKPLKAMYASYKHFELDWLMNNV